MSLGNNTFSDWVISISSHVLLLKVAGNMVSEDRGGKEWRERQENAG